MIADEILTELDPWQQHSLRGQLRLATVVRVQNVAEWYWTGCDQEYWDLRHDFPNCMPPWPVAWYEWRQPKLINSSVYGPHYEAGGAFGVMLVTIKHQTLDGLTAIGAACFGAGFGLPSAYLGNILRLVRPDGSLYTEREEHPFISDMRGELNRTVIPEHTVNAILDARARERGVTLPESARISSPNLLVNVAPIYPESAAIDVAGTIVTGCEKVVWLAHSFAHCKNVARRVELVDRALIKKRATHGRAPITRHTTLVIDPIRAAIRDAQRTQSCTASKAFHFVRGHFKRYTSEAPLLGKHVGTFFFAMHTAGAKAAGTVVKDYDVHPKPKGDS